MLCRFLGQKELTIRMHSVDSINSGVSPGGPVDIDRESRSRLLSWLSRRRISLAVLAGILVLVGLATAWNLEGWPGRVDDDEGTYVAQAWAILYQHTLTHYSYWYDHPPLGWAQIALFAWVTDGFNRVADAVFVGREFMWLITLISCALLYALCRRLSMRRATSAVTVLLFGLSPLGQFFHRLVSLDNVATMWVLAALVIAAGPRRGWRQAIAAGACAAIAVLSKETALILLPAVVWVLLRGTGEAGEPGSDPGMSAGAGTGTGTGAWVSRVAAALGRLPGWGQRLVLFAAAWCVVVAVYPLYALQRGELGSLWTTLCWQFFNRPGSGSLLDSGTATHAAFHGWLTTDPWLLGAGLIAAVLALGSARLRPFAAVLLLQVVVLCKDSYLPYFYVTAMLPFAAICLGGAADALWAPAAPGRLTTSLTAWAGRLDARAARYVPYAGRVIAAAAALSYAILVVPGWVSGLSTDSTANGDTPYLAAISWAERHVPKDSTVVVDDYLWVDLKRDGLSPLWMWKISPQTVPDGWKSISYIILQPQSAGTLAGIPALQDAYAHSVLVKDFGNGLTARRVTVLSSS
jgi:hypothetical protein